jgi:polyisoprenoid-binding protein YceI
MTGSTINQTAKATTWTLDPAHTLVEFAAKHLMITTVKGRFADVSGTITMNEADPASSSVQAVIKAASIDTRTGQRDTHLKSADFLEVEKYPEITFASTKVEPAGEDRLRITGDLTIHGVTKSVVLEVTDEGRSKDPWGGIRAGFSATTRIDRRDFGLTWNQALETGGVMVSNEIRITIEAEATKAA